MVTHLGRPMSPLHGITKVLCSELEHSCCRHGWRSWEAGLRQRCCSGRGLWQRPPAGSGRAADAGAEAGAPAPAGRVVGRGCRRPQCPAGYRCRRSGEHHRTVHQQHVHLCGAQPCCLHQQALWQTFWRLRLRNKAAACIVGGSLACFFPLMAMGVSAHLTSQLDAFAGYAIMGCCWARRPADFGSVCLAWSCLTE